MHKRVRRHRVSGTCPLGRGPSGSREYESKQQRLPPGWSTVLGTNSLARTGGQRARRCHLGAQSCQCCCSGPAPFWRWELEAEATMSFVLSILYFPQAPKKGCPLHCS